MGRSHTPKYVVEIHDNTSAATSPMEWRVRSRNGLQGHGKPTNENLQRYVMQYAKSLEPNGPNAHISHELGYVPYPTAAIIRLNQPNSPPIAVWKAAMFQVFN